MNTTRHIPVKKMMTALAKTRMKEVTVIGIQPGAPFLATSRATDSRAAMNEVIADLRWALTEAVLRRDEAFHRSGVRRDV